MGKEVFNVDFKRAVYLLLSRICPTTAENLGICNIPAEVTKFFAAVIEENIRHRKANNITRPDFTQLLMDLQEATKDHEKPFTFDELIGNVILFFIAGRFLLFIPDGYIRFIVAHTKFIYFSESLAS